MTCIDQLLRLVDIYAEANGLEQTTVSWRLFSDTAKLQSLREGRDLQTKRFEHALRFLSANWPEGVPWPDDIARPVTEAAA